MYTTPKGITFSGSDKILLTGLTTEGTGYTPIHTPPSPSPVAHSSIFSIAALQSCIQ